MGVGEGDRVAVRTVAVTPQGMRVYGNDFPLHEGSGLFGGYAEYMELVPGSAVHRLRDDLPAAELTVFESLCNAVTWVHPVNPGDVLVVEGPGHMGLASVVAAKARGADTIIVTGLSRDRLRLDTALRVGADHVIDVEKENAVERVAEITGGRMADVVLDAASGNPVTFRNAIDLVRPSGTVVAAGFKDCPVEGFDVSWIPRRNLKILPGAGLDLAGACALINDGRVATADLLGEAFPLERFEEALALLDRRLPGATRCACRCRSREAPRARQAPELPPALA